MSESKQVPEPRPVVKARKRGRAFPIFFVVVVLAIVGFFFYRARNSSGAAEPSYRVATVQKGTIRRTVAATGTLQPWSTVDIKSKAGGRVEELDVDIGSVVKPGQIIAKIDPSDSLLTYNQAKADTDSANAKESQGGAVYRLQVAQSQSSIQQAQAAVGIARANLSAATARLQAARDSSAAQPSQTAATIATAKANYDSTVQARAQLTQTQTQDRAAAQAAYDQAAANDRNAQANLVRVRSLYQQGFTAAADVDVAIASAGVTSASLATARAKLNTIGREQSAVALAEDAKVRQALEQLNSAKAQIDVQTRHTSVDEALAAQKQAASQLAQTQAQLAQAQADVLNNQIKSYDIATARAARLRAEAALVNTKTTLDQTVVRAPTAGVILQKYVEPGTIITSGLSLNSTGASIVQIGDISKMYVYVLVDETDIASVRVDQRVDISLDAYPGTPFNGRVSRVDPQAQVAQNVTSVGVRIEIDNSNASFKLLKPNLNATCEFIVEEKRSVLWVPSDAVQSDSNGSYVQVVLGPSPVSTPAKGGKTAKRTQTLKQAKTERRNVETGFKGDDSIEIVSGLKEGDVVVVQAVAASATASPRPRGAVGGFGGGGGGPPPGGR